MVVNKIKRGLARLVFLCDSIVGPRARRWALKTLIDYLCEPASGVRFLGEWRIDNLSGIPQRLRIGDNSTILGHLYVMAHGGEISIGRECYIGEGSRIWSAARITIGDRVQISHNVNIHDTNTHSVSAHERYLHAREILTHAHPRVLDNVAAKSVVIGDDCWVGFNATILKGVTLGKGAIVGACSLVTKDVPPYAIVAGNPARIIGCARE